MAMLCESVGANKPMAGMVKNQIKRLVVRYINNAISTVPFSSDPDFSAKVDFIMNFFCRFEIKEEAGTDTPTIGMMLVN